jgi:hypothetical protein
LTHPHQPIRFLTGTDEHGLKIQKAAREQRLGENEFCDAISERFRVGSFFTVKKRGAWKCMADYVAGFG